MNQVKYVRVAAGEPKRPVAIRQVDGKPSYCFGLDRWAPSVKKAWAALQMSDTDYAVSLPVEAHGVQGLQSKPWRRTFPSVAALNSWCERHDAEVLGTRSPEQSH